MITLLACTHLVPIFNTVCFDFEGLRLPTLKLILKPTHSGRPAPSFFHVSQCISSLSLRP